MKLTIDTKEDSHEDIKKAIRMLSTIVGDEHVYTNSPPKEHHANIFESSSSSLGISSPEPEQPAPSAGGIFNMFGPAQAPSSEAVDKPQPEDSDEAPEKKPEIIIEY